jgi:hypothetical protein
MTTNKTPLPEDVLKDLRDHARTYFKLDLTYVAAIGAALVPGLPVVCGASRCWRGGAAEARSAILAVLPSRLLIHHSLL